MSIPVFSKRHGRALRDNTLSFSVSRRLRGRIRKTIEKYNFEYRHQPDPYDNWRGWTSTMEEAEIELCRIEGVDKLVALNFATDERIETDLGGFIEGAYPSGVFDAVEVFLRELEGEQKASFRQDINQVFAEEGTPWRLLDEIIVKLDTSMLDSGVADHTVDVLRAMNLEGALDEFRDAVDEFTEGDSRDAIQDACNAFESVLKSITGGTGNASQLLNELVKGPHLNDLPEDQQKSVKQVLQALPILGNNLGRHGQGPEIVEVHPRYAQLAVHLAGASIIFLLDAHTAVTPKAEDVPDEPVEMLDDWGPSEAPF